MLFWSNKWEKWFFRGNFIPFQELLFLHISVNILSNAFIHRRGRLNLIAVKLSFIVLKHRAASPF